MSRPSIRRERLRFIFIEDGAYIYHSERKNVKVVNKVGALILEQCDGTRSVMDIVENLSKIYPNVDKSRLTHDVINFINKCIEEGFLSFQVEG